MKLVFSGSVTRAQRRFVHDLDTGVFSQVVVVDAEDMTGARCSVASQAPQHAELPKFGETMQLYMQPSTACLAIGFSNVLHHDWTVESGSIDQSYDATQVVTLPECPDDYRHTAEAQAKALGVTLAWYPGKLVVQTGRGPISKELAIPGMIEPKLGWRKLLTELGLMA